MKFSREQKFKIIEELGFISDEDRHEFPGIHWCWDWDFMLIDDESPEKSSCCCYYTPEHMKYNGPIKEICK